MSLELKDYFHPSGGNQSSLIIYMS
ncbi:hypothetical protein OIU77_007784 [Salix suchowensis]|nr:hypothetical protein OIU77_007784 [Salix suchowensis]